MNTFYVYSSNANEAVKRYQLIFDEALEDPDFYLVRDVIYKMLTPSYGQGK